MLKKDDIAQRKSKLAARRANLSAAKQGELENLLKIGSTEGSAKQVIQRHAEEGPVPLSFAQQRLWFLDQLEPGNAAYNIPVTFRLNGQLRVAALRQSLNETIRRHEALRTNFTTKDGQPVQAIEPSLMLDLPIVNLEKMTEAERESEARRQALADFSRPFDLTSSPLLRVTLLRLAEEEHTLLVTMHHIISDGWSLQLLIHEVGAAYKAFCTGEPSPLEELPIQYADYAQWQREWLQGEVLEGELSYWRKQLQDSPPTLNLPADRPHPAVMSLRGETLLAEIPQKLTKGLRALSQKQGVTLFTTLLASFQLLLSRYSGQDDIVVGTPVAGRRWVETEALIGFFVNTLVLRTKLSGKLTTPELLARVGEVVMEAQSHQDLPFEKLVEELRPERSLSHTPLFQVMFVLQNVPKKTVDVQDLTLSVLDSNPGVEKFNLTLSIAEEEHRLACSLSYNTDLFDASTMNRMLNHWQQVLEAMVNEPEKSLLDVGLLTDEERHQLLYECNQPETFFHTHQCLHSLFESHALSRPDAVALSFHDHALTYADLNRRANQLSYVLSTLGVTPESCVALLFDRSSDFVIALLAVLKSGAAYLPLDSTSPPHRLRFILDDTRAALLLTQHSLLNALADCQLPHIFCIDRDWQQVQHASTENPPSCAHPDNPAYVIYTSGSTGQPKGVLVTHRNVARLFLATAARFSFDEHDVWTMFHSPAFDFSVWELWGALLTGGRCVVVPYWVSRSPERFAELLADEQVTVLNQTPSAFLQLMRAVVSREHDRALSLRWVIFGGEALDLQSLKPWVERYGDAAPRLVNMYGITETTVHVTYRELSKSDVMGEAAGSRIGLPIADLQVHVLDAHGQLAPVGVAGEMMVGGAGLARGYLGRADLTAERFVPDGCGTQAGRRLYRSGDVARRRGDDGELEYLGRLDNQVKIRGHRIELGEVETVLRKYAGVREAVVIDREWGEAEKRLVAYIVWEAGAAAGARERGAMQEWLRERLPDYMMPWAVMEVAEIALTGNGKVDRRGLPEVAVGGVEAEERGEREEGARTMVEEVVAGVWEEVLGVEGVRRRDNFFWLGGHSLLATRVITKLRERMKVEIPVRSVFESPTLSGMAGRVEATMRNGNGHQQMPPLRPAASGGMLPLSYAQQRLWFLDQLMPSSSAYNIPAALQLDVELNVATLEQCLNEEVRRHEALRTTFINVGGEPTQVIDEFAPRDLPIIDLSRLADEQKVSEVTLLAREEALRPFDLAKGPLMRASLLLLGERQHVVFMTMHHIVSDAWSMGVLAQEVETLYHIYENGAPSSLTELEVQYADYAQWQREWLQGEVLEAELGYWKKQLAGAPAVLELETDFPHPVVRTLQGSHCSLALSEEASRALRAFSRKEGATVFMTLMAAFQALLGRYTWQDDFLIGTPVAGRGQAEVENLIGFFVNMVPLRADLGGSPSFRELLKRVRESALGAYAHQDLPFDKLVEELQPERRLGRNPLFQAILSYQNEPVQEIEMSGLTVPIGNQGNADTKFDLEVYFWDNPNRVTGSFVYSHELFEHETIARMVEHFQIFLEKMLAAPDESLSRFTLMAEPELHRVLEEWNDTAVDFPSESSVAELFEKQAAGTPDAIALESEQEQVSYYELNRRANVLAHHLRAQGVRPEVFVGIILDRSVEMIVSLLGIAKAGGIYVPINISDPAKRIGFIFEDANISVLLTTKQVADGLPENQLTVVCLDDREVQEKMLVPGSEENPPVEAGGQNLLYMMYTSGSTGTPKGVCITHRNVLRLVKGANYANFDSREVFLQFAPISFDASTFEIWGSLLNGARLILFPPIPATLNDLGDVITKSQVSTLWLTAGLFHQMVDGNLKGLRTVKQLLAGGESLSITHVKKVLEDLGECRLINGYGPTETTTFACCHAIQARPQGVTVPIGRPISNTSIYLLNSRLQPSAIGERGELYIGGDGLARGYLNRPDLTAERFVPDQFSHQPGARLYRTGDLARYQAKGYVEFLGRLDHQVKIRGFRIELGEIETALSEHPAIKEAVLMAREDTPGDKRLVAYVVAEGDSAPGSEELKNYLKERLPEYMLPSVCIILDELPLTPNGKVDRRALPAPDRSLIKSERAYIAPKDALQEQLVVIWEDLLGIRPIGINDDFFELGGHSLLIVQLVARIEERTGKRIPMTYLFEKANVETISQLISQDKELPSWSLLVPIQPNGTNPNVFFIHPAGGNVISYTELSRALGQEQPFYGIQAREINSDLLPHTQIEAMAAEYADAIRAFQPLGPYFIGGWSMGGVVAFEVARQLREHQQQVALLAIIDAEAPSGRSAQYAWIILLASFARDLGIPFDRMNVVGEEVSKLPQMAQLKRIWVEAKALSLIPAELTLVDFRKLFDSFKANAQMMRSYTGGAYEGRLTLFRADKEMERITHQLPENFVHIDEEQEGVDPRDPLKGWGRWATEGVELYTIPGDHYSIVREPNVKVLAEQLRDCIQNAAKEI